GVTLFPAHFHAAVFFSVVVAQAFGIKVIVDMLPHYGIEEEVEGGRFRWHKFKHRRAWGFVTQGAFKNLAAGQSGGG
ncbi:MAG TPA: hypothetical protein VII55_00380, partial [Candidatus Saccharimonadales bacterium]